MFSEKSKTVLLILLSLSLLLAGSAYLVFLHGMFPKLVPGYGGGEGFTLGEYNNYSAQLPWSAYSRLHLALQANDTLELYVDGDYVCDCSHYELVIERGDEALILLRSDSPVKGRFTARQEIPLEKQLFAFTIILAGLIGVALSIKMRK
ncbi:hypothetical protein KAU18_07090 [Candidatus Bathyarchaeota archaeon]|nr:hypothetical protein [Candidatus Bathyarchaeota archaeon]